MGPRDGRSQTKTPLRRRAPNACATKRAHADHRIHPQRQRRPPTRSHRAPRAGHPADAGRSPARPFGRRLPQPLRLHAGGGRAGGQGGDAGAFCRRARRHRLAAAPGRASASRRRRCRAVRSHRGCLHGRMRGACEGRRSRDRRTLSGPGLSLRGGLGQPRAQEPRRHPPRRVRRAGGEDGLRRLGPGLWPGDAARCGRCVGRRRPHAAHRVQHQPQHRPPGGGEEDCHRHPPQQRRAAVCQGDGYQARRSQPRAGIDEPHELREDTDLPRVRDGQARSRALRRHHSRERSRRPRAGGRTRSAQRSSTCSSSALATIRFWKRSCGTAKPVPLPHRRAAPARCRRTSSCGRGCCARRRGHRPCARCCPAERRAP